MTINYSPEVWIAKMRKNIPFWQSSITLDVLEENPKEASEFFQFLNKFLSKVSTEVERKAPGLVPDFLTYTDQFLTKEFSQNPKDYYPIWFSVSSEGMAEDSIGISLDSTGKFEIIEGNDLASEETIILVNSLVGTSGKSVKVFTTQSELLIQQIQDTLTAPAGMYVSPSLSYSRGFWHESRVTVSFTIDIGTLSQESSVDWRVLTPTKISNLKFL